MIIAIWTLVVVSLVPGMMSIRVDTSTDGVLDRHSDAWSFYERSQSIFGGDELIVVATRSDVPFSKDALLEHERLSRAFEGIDGVARVDSLATFPVVRVNDQGDLTLEPPLSMIRTNAITAAETLREVVQFDRILPDTLVSRDGRTLAISLVVEPKSEDQQARILQTVRTILGDTPAWVSGTPVFRVEANIKTQVEVLRFAQATGVVLGAYLLLAFRRVRAVAFGLIPGVVGTIATVSAMGVLNVPLSIATMILPSMLIALGCAYSMHILVACSGCEDREDICVRAGELALPLILSGLTTAIGLLSLSLVRIDAVAHVGIYGSLGVLVTTLVAVTFLPSALILYPVDRRMTGAQWNFEKLVDHIESHRHKWLAGWVAVVVLFSFGLTRVEIETDATTWFRDSNPVRDAYLEIRERLSGISPLNVVLTAPEGSSLLEPSSLAQIDALSDFLKAQPEVGKAISIADPLRQLSGGFLKDSLMPIPDSRILAEQYMLLLDGVEMISDVISSDRSIANIVLRVDDNSSANILDLAARAESWWAINGDSSVTARTTGVMFEFARAEDAIAFGQISGLLAALGAISIILFLILRRFRLSLVALVPNVVPLFIIFGLMGIAGIPVDAGTVLIGSLALGIAVDDTIHIVTAFVDGVENGCSSRDSLKDAFQRVLPAVVSSTAMIVVGFGVFFMSDFALTRNLGWLTGSVMIVCLLADVFLLGVLLLSRDWRHS